MCRVSSYSERLPRQTRTVSRCLAATLAESGVAAHAVLSKARTRRQLTHTDAPILQSAAT